MDASVAAPNWVMWPADGAPVPVTTTIVIGRSPTAAVLSEAVSEPPILVTVDDGDRLVSRSHLVLRPAGSRLEVHNASTRNPVTIVDLLGGVVSIATGQRFEVERMSRVIVGDVIIDLIPA